MRGLLSNEQQAPIQEPAQAEQRLTPEDQQKIAQVDELSKQAMQILYADEKQFEKLVALFKSGGPEGFAQNMSVAVNGVIDRIEQQNGELNDEVLAGIGITLISAIAQDLATGGIIQLDKDMIQQAAVATMQNWMNNHAERVDVQGAQQAAQMAGGMQ